MNTKVFKIIVLNLVGVIIVYLLLMAGCRALIMRSFQPDAKAMYRHYFSTPIEKVKGLRSGGMAWLDNPVCIKFRSKETIILKDQNLYSPADSSVPRRFFLREYPNDKIILNDVENLVCIRYDKKVKASDNRQYSLLHWLLYNKKTGSYYFLIE
ncbi:MAG: hypothetical protein M0R48_01235 [Candidatus Omnitrophica bacterium]|jgi:hypothetical protein|nr:hypothetical protein [Candidatus Omnitrophota bacterium]